MSGIIAYDLAIPTASLLTAPRTCYVCGGDIPSLAASFSPLRGNAEPEPHAACHARAAAVRAERAAAAESDALFHWEQERTRHPDSPALLAVLDLHRPKRGYESAGCSECEQHHSYKDVEPVPWPCPTYIAVRDT
jgi:hypothetical protein